MKKKWKERLNRKILFPLLHTERGREESHKGDGNVTNVWP